MATSTTKPRYGVRLTLPGAPDEEHQIPGLHIPVRPGIPAPLETDEDIARARELAGQGADIEVVELPVDDKPAKRAGKED